MKKIQIIILTISITSFLNAQVFHQDIDQSLSIAKDDQKAMLMIFSGSDWCKPCIQLKESILADRAFSVFSDDHLVLLEVDFPYKRKNKLSKTQEQHNKKLADRYNPDGFFPLVVLFDQNEKVLGTIAYQKNMQPEKFIEQIKQLIPSK